MQRIILTTICKGQYGHAVISSALVKELRFKETKGCLLERAKRSFNCPHQADEFNDLFKNYLPASTDCKNIQMIGKLRNEHIILI